MSDKDTCGFVHPVLSRGDAEALISVAGLEVGRFLVREKDPAKSLFAYSVYFDDRFFHFLMSVTPNGIDLDGRLFEGIFTFTELVRTIASPASSWRVKPGRPVFTKQYTQQKQQQQQQQQQQQGRNADGLGSVDDPASHGNEGEASALESTSSDEALPSPTARRSSLSSRLKSGFSETVKKFRKGRARSSDSLTTLPSSFFMKMDVSGESTMDLKLIDKLAGLSVGIPPKDSTVSFNQATISVTDVSGREELACMNLRQISCVAKSPAHKGLIVLLHATPHGCEALVLSPKKKGDDTLFHIILSAFESVHNYAIGNCGEDMFFPQSTPATTNLDLTGLESVLADIGSDDDDDDDGEE